MAHEHRHETAGAVALTKNQMLVFEALNGAAQPMSAYVILDKLRDSGLRAPLQVYRALDKLIDTGLVHRLESLNAFVACAHPHCHEDCASAFAICETCGSVTEFSDDEIMSRLRGWSSAAKFRPGRMTVEVRGVCAACGGLP
jgi:Fur family transcriptional regulator, zinc uptake regulator